MDNLSISKSFSPSAAFAISVETCRQGSRRRERFADAEVIHIQCLFSAGDKNNETCLSPYTTSRWTPLVTALTACSNAAPMIGGHRNDLCPYGSGKKFKRCHGAPSETAHW